MSLKTDKMHIIYSLTCQESNFQFLLFSFRFLSQIGGGLDQMGSAVLRQSVESSVQSSGLDVLAKFLDTTPETLQLIVDGLIRPPGFDIRQGKNQSVTCPHCFLSIEDSITFVSKDICRAKTKILPTGPAI